MNRSALFFYACVLALAPALSQAREKTSWSAAMRPYIEARSNETESDATVRASCAFGAKVQLRLGASYDVGKGKGEPVSLKIESNGKTAKFEGVSKDSPDSEMTGGTELVTEVSIDDPALEVLFSGKAVMMVTPDQKKHTLVDADASGAAKKFLKQCRGG